MRLGIVMKKWRLMTEMDLRSASEMIGISASTLMRIEMGHDPDYRTFKKILDWLSEKVQSANKSPTVGKG